MPETGPKMEKFSALPRVFRLIGELPEERQLLLLRQLLQDRLKQHLFKAVIDLSDEQQVNLLKQLDKMPAEEMPVKTVSLEEDTSAMRGYRRKRCLITVNYTAGGRPYRDYILDIGSVGVFIETDTVFSIGTEMNLTFKLPNSQHPLKLNAAVAWVGNNGVGVKFLNLSPNQEEIIGSYLKEEAV